MSCVTCLMPHQLFRLFSVFSPLKAISARMSMTITTERAQIFSRAILLITVYMINFQINWFSKPPLSTTKKTFPILFRDNSTPSTRPP